MSDGSRTNTVIATDMAQIVVLKGAQSSALPVTTTSGAGNATSTVTRVAANAASVTLLASNTNRKGASFWNNSNQPLYIKLGTTANIGAGTESFTVALAAIGATPVGIGGYYEVPFNYTGRVDGIWLNADATGEALIDEVTA